MKKRNYICLYLIETKRNEKRKKKNTGECFSTMRKNNEYKMNFSYAKQKILKFHCSYKIIHNYLSYLKLHD